MTKYPSPEITISSISSKGSKWDHLNGPVRVGRRNVSVSKNFPRNSYLPGKVKCTVEFYQRLKVLETLEF